VSDEIARHYLVKFRPITVLSPSDAQLHIVQITCCTSLAATELNNCPYLIIGVSFISCRRQRFRGGLVSSLSVTVSLTVMLECTDALTCLLACFFAAILPRYIANGPYTKRAQSFNYQFSCLFFLFLCI